MDEFLTWEEMREMEKSGLIDFQAHSHEHAAYFESDRIVSFYQGGMNTKLPWATGGDMRLGIPIYEMGPSLCARKFYDDKGLRDELAGFVERNGGIDFFYRQNAIDLLRKIAENRGNVYGKQENEQEADDRIMGELKLTKGLIEKNLNKKVDYICWPWGSVDKPLIERAKRAGFVGGIGMKGGANMKLVNRFDIHRFNASPKTIPSLKRKLYKHSRLFFSLYNDKRLDNLLIPVSKFE